LGGFFLLLLFDFSALQLVLYLLLAADYLRELLLCDFCLNKCDLLLLPGAQCCQPIKAFPHKAHHLLGAFHRTAYVIFRPKHILTECPSRRDQTVCQIAHFVSLFECFVRLSAHLFA
jgi:hypothetical protein